MSVPANHPVRGPRAVVLALAIAATAACAVRATHDRDYVSSQLSERSGSGIGDVRDPGETSIPDGVSLAEGLAEDDAVAVALWNNPAFQADLAALGFARADLLHAGLLRNPVLSLLFGSGPKQMEATLAWPIDELWQRPRRVAAARLDAEGVAEGLVQNGLDLIRDTRIGFAETLRLDERVRLGTERAAILERIAELDGRRFEEGDVSALEADGSRIDALLAADAARKSAVDAASAHDRLQVLLGLDPLEKHVEPRADGFPSDDAGNLDDLLQTALAARPDLRAAELEIEAAGRRVGWERSQVLRLVGMIDANEVEGDEDEIGPGLELEIPIFNANRHGIVRAEAEIERATWSYVAMRREIVREVREAYARFQTAQRSYREWSENIIPKLEVSEARVRRALETGESSRLDVLGAQRRLVEARIRFTDVAAELRTSRARLARAIGTDAARWSARQANAGGRRSGHSIAEGTTGS